MAHVNCMSCSQQQLNWPHQPPNHASHMAGWDQPNHNLRQHGSNMSLNMPPSHPYYPQQMASAQHPPPAWTNAWGAPHQPPNMYQYAGGMMPMNQGNLFNDNILFSYLYLYFF